MKEGVSIAWLNVSGHKVRKKVRMMYLVLSGIGAGNQFKLINVMTLGKYEEVKMTFISQRATEKTQRSQRLC